MSFKQNNHLSTQYISERDLKVKEQLWGKRSENIPKLTKLIKYPSGIGVLYIM